jgi:hypothetical protein
MLIESEIAYTLIIATVILIVFIVASYFLKSYSADQANQLPSQIENEGTWVECNFFISNCLNHFLPQMKRTRLYRNLKPNKSPGSIKSRNQRTPFSNITGCHRVSKRTATTYWALISARMENTYYHVALVRVLLIGFQISFVFDSLSSLKFKTVSYFCGVPKNLNSPNTSTMICDIIKHLSRNMFFGFFI